MLRASEFDVKNLNVVGKGYHSEEKVAGFYNVGGRVEFWGSRGAFWGLFLGGLVITTPLGGPGLVLGFIATVAISGVETAILMVTAACRERTTNFAAGG